MRDQVGLSDDPDYAPNRLFKGSGSRQLRDQSWETGALS